jgi:hypothetical protein
VNDRLTALDTVDAAVHEDIEHLEGLVSDRLIDRVQAGETISHLEQLAAMIAGYRESLLIIRGEIQSLRPSTLPIAQAETNPGRIAALNDLGQRSGCSRLQEETAAIRRVHGPEHSPTTPAGPAIHQDMVR